MLVDELNALTDVEAADGATGKIMINVVTMIKAVNRYI